MSSNKVWCLLIDHDHKPAFGEPFPVSISPDDTVHDLKKKIKAGYDKLPNISPNELEVWKGKGFPRSLSAKCSFGLTKKSLGNFAFCEDGHGYSDVQHLVVTQLLVELSLESGELLLVLDRQRINGTSFVFSVAVPTLLEVSASEGISFLRNTLCILSILQENVSATRAVLDRVEVTTILWALKAPNIASPASRDAMSFDIAGEECVLQDIVDNARPRGVRITHALRLREQELVETRPSILICLAVMAGLSRKECKRAAGS
ncbi:hypothetical protein V8E53_002887 [Lactarius tabidus]